MRQYIRFVQRFYMDCIFSFLLQKLMKTSMPISYLVDGYSRMRRKTKSAMSAQIQIGMVIHMNLTTQEYEKLYQIHYIVAIRDKGLILKSINTVMQEMKENN